MIIKRLFTVLASLILVASPLTLASSPVWKISKGDDHIYLGGTIHVLAEADYPLPPAFANAYASTDTLILEADVTSLQTPEFQQQLFQKMSYPPGQSLIDFLTPDTIDALTAYCESRNIPLQSLSQFKPGMLTVIMTMAELQNLGQAGTGVDHFFYLQAKNSRKAIHYLESAEQQLSMLINMGKGKENELIAYTLKDISHISVMLGELKQAWREGNLVQLTKLGITPMKEMDETLYRQLVAERNKAWIPHLVALFNNQQKELVLVGTLHLAGIDSVLTLLKSEGYQIEQMP